MLKLPYPISTNLMWRQVRTPSRTIMVASKAALAYKASVAASCRQAGTVPLTGPVSVAMRLHPRLTAKGVESKTRIDLDNCIKCALDALQGHAYHDDSQVVALTALVAEPCQGGALSVLVEPAQYQD